MSYSDERRSRFGFSAAVALAVAITGEAAAADIDALIDYRSDNRSGTRASTEAIGELIAERTQSDAVRRRARALRPQGSLEVGVNELLQDIGAYRMIGRLAGVGGPVATPVPMQRPGTPASAATAVVERPSAGETRSRESIGRNWNTGSSGFFGSETADRGNADNSGGGVSSASSGGGGVAGGAAGNTGDSVGSGGGGSGDRASSDGGGSGDRGGSVSYGGGGSGYGFSGGSGVGGFSSTP